MSRTSWQGTVWAGLLASGLATTSCVLDPEARCDENMELVGDGVKCACTAGYAFTPTGCVKCRANEVASAEGCVCDEGYSRSTEGRCARVEDDVQGTECSADGDCTSPVHDTCFDDRASSYCTATGCASDEDCEGGYACDTAKSPSVCRRPPIGAGQSCESAEDCSDTEATYCEVLMSNTCVVQGCSTQESDCFVAEECCDLSAFGLPTLCVPEGRCP